MTEITNCFILKKTISVVNSKLEGQTKTVLKLDKMSQPMTGNFYKGVQIDFKLFNKIDFE
jgi:hypothetical protein